MSRVCAHGVFLDHLLIIILLTLVVAQLAMRSDGRYLRPADHGLLTYQNSTIITTPTTKPNAAEPQHQDQMSSFFNGAGTPTTQSNLPLPEAKNITTDTTTSTTNGGGGVENENDDWWKRKMRSRRHRGSRDHLKEVLLVASLVCGVAGVVFLAISGVIFLSRCRRQRVVASQSTASTLELTGDSPASSAANGKLVAANGG